MLRIATAAALTIALAAPVSADTIRTLTESIQAAGVEQVVIEARVGDVEIVASPDARVVVEVTLTPRRGGLFSSMRRAEEEVREASLRLERVGGELTMEVDSDSGDRRFEESWSIALPARMAVRLEHGVGDVRIRGIAGGLDIEHGVGDVLVEATGGDLSIEVGVGDVTVDSFALAYGRVEVAAGVGSASLKAAGRRVSSEGFIGRSAEWRGEGPSQIDVEVGVGDALVTLR